MEEEEGEEGEEGEEEDGEEEEDLAAKACKASDRFKRIYLVSKTGEYSCRCHGKGVISAPSEPLKLKLAGHIL